MKIEMGESLLYSWLRHVKECQIVQTNWKISPQWELKNRDQISELLQESDKAFQKQFNSYIYKDSSLEQFLKQAEVDVLGISLSDNSPNIYAVDVAFHEAGLNYGSKPETVARVAKKCMRTAMCLYGYLNLKEGEIIFASPKIHNAIITDLLPFIELSNKVLRDFGFEFHVRIIANGDFEEKILSPILVASQGISDTSELFLRSYQMYKMFASDTYSSKATRKLPSTAKDRNNDTVSSDAIQQISDSGLDELKVGRIANTVLRSMLESGRASEDEIEKMQTADYSKDTFHLNYPLLVMATEPYEKARYYTNPLRIKGLEYFLCSQWFEVPANNDRPDLLKWIALHK
jgi:hypothetical protein